MNKVIWTPTAIKSLRQTTNFIIGIWNQNVVDDFFESARQANTTPIMSYVFDKYNYGLGKLKIKN